MIHVRVYINRNCTTQNHDINNLDKHVKAKDIIKANIDYHLSTEFYMTDIEKLIMDGKIATLNSKLIKNFQSDYAALLNLAADIVGGSNE